jgi:DNA repair exonuclease SbcCD ATPase subunit
MKNSILSHTCTTDTCDPPTPTTTTTDDYYERRRREEEMTTTCKDLAIKSGLIELLKAHLAADEERDYLGLAEKLEKKRPTDEDGENLSKIKRKLEEAEKAYYAGLTPMFEAKKRLRDEIVHAWPEYVAASQTYEEARKGYEMAFEALAEKEESYRRKYSEFKQREKSHMQSHQGGGDGFSMPMWTLTEPRKIAELKADCDALARKVREAEEAFTAYKESIKYHYIARGMLEAMNDFE